MLMTMKFFITNRLLHNALTDAQAEDIAMSISWGFSMEQIYELFDYFTGNGE